ncbi:hypothetical protein O6H91_08G035300 [Diphasiastrum complanatum]|uniref:Uncharacterized protein n=1 Tax=Diphasiastrum complanatum TaxID=34168 RepID=A0ACC2CWF5_DIPCM|nr:hypothetical protein O6H91_08G035300 [Diphasiastrum complanatum]
MKQVPRRTLRSNGIADFDSKLSLNVISAQKDVRQLPPQYAEGSCLVGASGCRDSSWWEVNNMLDSIDCQSIKPSSRIYARLLKQCSISRALSDGRRVHSHLLRSYLARDRYLNNLLISMYCKCGCLKEADRVFKNMPVRDVVAWSAMISAYAQNAHFREAVQLYKEMKLENVQPNKITFLSILKACIFPEALTQGRMVHASIVQMGFESDVVLGTALINMYNKCGSVEEARRVFDKMPKRDVVSWTSMIAAYADAGHGKEALDHFRRMELEGVIPNKITFVNALNACDSHTALTQGKLLHAEIMKRGFGTNVIVATALVDMYSKCGSLEDACQIFERMPKRDVILWNTMIAAYGQRGYWEAVSDSITEMEKEGLKPNNVTLLNALQACSTPPAVALGQMIHHRIVENGYQETVLDNALVHMYGKCGDLQSAKRVFNSSAARDVVTWNAMTAAFALHGLHQKAFQSFGQMQLEGLMPDKITLMNLLNACCSSLHLEAGQFIHAHIVHDVINLNVSLGNSIIRMYDKCGSLQAARGTFNAMVEQDILSWNAIIASYVHHGNSKEALHLFWQMHFRGIKPDRNTFLTILDACHTSVILAEAKLIHAQVVKSDFEFDLGAGTTLIDMYGKMGDLQKACSLFDHLSQRDLVCWSAMIYAYAQNGRGQAALKIFGQLQLEGIVPNKITLMNVLSACSHAGLLDEGYHHFISIDLCAGVTLDLEHYGCMIDLLARAGQLDDAEGLIFQMPYKPSNVVWMSLLGACKVHGDVERGKRAAGHLLGSDPQNPAFYVAFSNIMQQAEGEKMQGEDAKLLAGRVNVCGDEAKVPFDLVKQRH